MYAFVNANENGEIEGIVIDSRESNTRLVAGGLLN